jgi:hypothetical protein
MFKKAEVQADRLKMYVYGEAGTGKTVTSLQFPSVACIDTEKGTKHYGKFFDFHRIETSSPKEVLKAVEELIEDPQGFKTIVIDPFTPLYEKIMDGHLTRLKIKNGNPNYTLQPKDYRPIKAEVKNLIDRLLSLDMNVIVTARSATLYSQEEFMKILGTKPDGPKDLPYMFDVVLELTKTVRDGKEVFIARTEKDRTNTLPATFDFTYQSFVEYVGIKGLEREPVVFDQKLRMNENVGRGNEIIYNKKKIKTAGVTAEQLTTLEGFIGKIGQEEMGNILKDDFCIDSLLDLKDSEAELLINDLKEKDKTTKSKDKK